MVKRIFAWQTDTLACHLYRTVYPLTHLNSQEWEYAWGFPPSDIHDWDVVVGQRIAGPNDGWRKLCKDPNVLAVYDLDDWLMGIDPGNTIPYSIYHPIETETWKNVEMADAVTVSTPKMAEAIEPVNPNVFVLPNCLHPDSLSYGVVPWRDKPIVGWAGSQFHHQDWDAHLVSQLVNLKGKVDFHMMGADYSYGALGARLTGFQGMDDYLRGLDFNIGLAPLSRNTFNDMKSWCKVMEYSARGIVPVASDWGQYPDWGPSVIISDDDKWGDTISWLLKLDSVRTEISEAVYQKACDWTIDKHVHKWEQVYNGAY